MHMLLGLPFLGKASTIISAKIGKINSTPGEVQPQYHWVVNAH